MTGRFIRIRAFFRRALVRVVRVCRGLCLALGVVFVLLLLLACTRVPFDVHRWLGTAAGLAEGPQEVVVVLGGSGMPSGPELLRLYHAAEVARTSPEAEVWLVHPEDTAILGAMQRELLLRGVAQERIRWLSDGTSTRAQALEVGAALPGATKARIAVVTAPENMYRTVRTFRKVGMEGAAGVPAFDTPMFVDLGYDHARIGGRRYVPDVSGSSGLRYTFWNYLKLEITCLREFAALVYYWTNGWI